MRPITRTLLLGGAAVALATAVSFADSAPLEPATIDQGIDAATLYQYHHTDQGTRLLPAAFLAALRMPDGSKVMSPANVSKWGFIVENNPPDKLNPYQWPVGFAVSDGKDDNGVPIAGITCAACHTGEIDYQGHQVRIEGGQSYINIAEFQRAVYGALQATAVDAGRRAQFLQDAVALGYPADRVQNDFQIVVATAADLLYGSKGVTGIEPGPGRVDAVQGIANEVFAVDMAVPSNAKDFDAPVDYPYLWDIWRLSWLQYNGFIPPLSDSRNIGEVLGVEGKMNLIDPMTDTANPEPQRWHTSVQIKNLQWMESTLRGLKAPVWPAAVLGPIDAAKAAQGRQLFVANCAGCHGIKQLPNGHWDVPIVPLKVVGTDPNQAADWAGRMYDASKLGLGTIHAGGLAVAINAVRKQLYAENDIPAAQQQGDVQFGAACGYKARPLIGVWATPPFLHDGSVPTIYDLLSDTRPATYHRGTREYDPVKLGYVEDTSPDAMLFNTAIAGNRNTGHWWTDDQNRPGRIGPKLTEDEKYAIIEYLKSATYDNYPTVQATASAPVPCADDPDWAQGFTAR